MQKVTSDDMGLLVSQTWKRILNPYTPRDTGLTEETARIRPWEIEYIQPGSAYVYFGEIYVDPVTGASGFLTDEGWLSRRGVQKVPSGRMMQYQKNNPYATDHWDIKAAEAGQLDKLYRTLNSANKSGRI